MTGGYSGSAAAAAVPAAAAGPTAAAVWLLQFSRAPRASPSSQSIDTVSHASTVHALQSGPEGGTARAPLNLSAALSPGRLCLLTACTGRWAAAEAATVRRLTTDGGSGATSGGMAAATPNQGAQFPTGVLSRFQNIRTGFLAQLCGNC